MEISATGKGLDILIRCTPSHKDDWLSFASWYSIKKNLPDATVALSVVGTRRRECFRWAYKQGVKIHSVEPENRFCILCTALAVREFISDCIGPVDAKSDEEATFVYCKEVGKFVVDSWIDRYGVPFGAALKRFSTNDMTVNEMKILKLWEKMDPLYVAVGG